MLKVPESIKIAMKKAKRKKLPHRMPFSAEQCKGIWLAWNYVTKKSFCKILNLSYDRCKLLYEFMIEYSKGKNLTDKDFKKIAEEFNNG